MTKLYIFGDSILGGVELDADTLRYQKGSFAPEVFLQSETLSVENLSCFGCTLPKSEKMLETCLENREKFDIALLELGGNDCDFQWKEISDDPARTHSPKVAPQAFKEGLARMVRRLRNVGVRPILTRLPPIDAARYFEWVSRGLDAQRILLFLKDVQRIYRHQELYAGIAAGVAAAEGVPLLDLRRPFLEHDDFCALLCADGIHPNARGHQLIERCMTAFFASALA